MSICSGGIYKQFNMEFPLLVVLPPSSSFSTIKKLPSRHVYTSWPVLLNYRQQTTINHVSGFKDNKCWRHDDEEAWRTQDTFSCVGKSESERSQYFNISTMLVTHRLPREHEGKQKSRVNPEWESYESVHEWNSNYYCVCFPTQILNHPGKELNLNHSCLL